MAFNLFGFGQQGINIPQLFGWNPGQGVARNTVRQAVTQPVRRAYATPAPTPPQPKPTTSYGPVQGPSSPGYVQGTANTVQSPIGPAGVLQYQAPTTTSGGNGGTTTNNGNAGVVNNPQPGFSSQDYSGALQQQQQQQLPDFDALIAPALAGLDAFIAPVQQQAADFETSINASRSTNLATNKADITGQQNTLNEAKSSQGAMAENAANEARRQYAEIQQGLQSRYGGTTGTGAFAAELAGRQTLQNIGKIREGLSQAMLQIDNKLQQVQEVGRIATQDIEDKAAQQIRDAKNNLDLQLADIRRQKGEIQANKASLAANAIQMYQNTVNNVNAQNASFKQNLYLQQQAAEQNLKLAQQKAQEVAKSYTPETFSNIGRQVTPVGNVVTQTQAMDQGGDLYQMLKKRFDALGTSNSPQGGVFGGL